MAVREFNPATLDEIHCATGALSGLAYGTLAVIAKRMATGAAHTIVTPALPNGTASGLRTEWTPFQDLALRDSAGGVSNVSAQGTADIWRLLVWRKATGSSVPRLSVYNFSTATWTHGNGHAALGDGATPNNGGSIRFASPGQFGGRAHMRLAMAAYWSNEVKWGTDAVGDAQVELAGLHTARQNWLDAAPSAVWAFNQSATTDPVLDLSTTGTADQIAITGTTVIVGDDPAGFSFGSGGTTPVGKDLGLQWHTRQAVGDELQTVWHTRQIIGDELQAVWEVRQAVGDNTQLVWHAQQAVAGTLDLQWSVRSIVADDVALVWNVASALISVGKVLGLQWNTRAAVGDYLQAIWHTHQLVASTLGLQWTVHQSVADTLGLLWDVRQPVSDGLQVLWAVREPVGDTVEFQWATRARAGDSLQLVWGVAVVTLPPAKRTFVVPADSRTFVVPARSRTHIVPAD